MPNLSRHDRYRLPLTRRLTGRWRVLPDFIILGAQKAGTTTIYDNLVKHPAVHPCDIKEVHFFDTNFRKGEDWYRGHFATAPEKRRAVENGQAWLTGEGSPYYLFHPLAPERVKLISPASRLIVILRDPVSRAYSHYQHEVRKGREPLTFEEAIRDEDSRLSGESERIIAGAGSFAHQHYSYKARGCYARQLEAWFRQFPREQFHIMESGQLNRDFPGSFRQLHQFLGIEPADLPQPKRSNVGSYDEMNDATRQQLAGFFAPHNERLFALLGQQFNWT